MTTTIATYRGEYALLEVALPSRPPVNAGVLLLDPEADRLHFRLRRDWARIASQDDAEVLALLAGDIGAKATEMGGNAFLAWCEENLSQTLRISERQPVLAGDFSAALDRLYRQHVPATVAPFVTHLPLYSASVAAGKFLGDQEVEATEWVETPENLRLDGSMFVARISGRSMEPRIPDGSLCAFRAGVAGSRQGKLVLVQNLGVSESGGRYSVKRYTSEKRGSAEGWRHSVIRLEPLNPEFDAWELEDDPDKFRIIAEFVTVL